MTSKINISPFIRVNKINNGNQFILYIQKICESDIKPKIFFSQNFDDYLLLLAVNDNRIYNKDTSKETLYSTYLKKRTGNDYKYNLEHKILEEYQKLFSNPYFKNDNIKKVDAIVKVFQYIKDDDTKNDKYKIDRFQTLLTQENKNELKEMLETAIKPANSNNSRANSVNSKLLPGTVSQLINGLESKPITTTTSSSNSKGESFYSDIWSTTNGDVVSEYNNNNPLPSVFFSPDPLIEEKIQENVTNKNNGQVTTKIVGVRYVLNIPKSINQLV